MNFSEGKATFSAEAINTFQKFVLSTSIKCQFPPRTMEVILKVCKEKLLSPVTGSFLLEFFPVPWKTIQEEVEELDFGKRIVS